MRPVLGFISNEPDIPFRRLSVKILIETIGAHIPEKDINLKVRIEVFQCKRVLHGMGAADPGAIVPFLIPAAHALNHDQAPGLAQSRITLEDKLFQLKLGDNPVMPAVKEFTGAIFKSTGRENGGTVPDRPDAAFGGHRGGKMADITAHIVYLGFMQHLNERILIHFCDQILQKSLNVHPIKGCMQSPGHAAQLRFLFQQIDLKALVGQAEGASHAGNPTADHKRGLVDRQIEFLKRLQVPGSGNGHPDQILCLLRGVFLFL